MPRSDGCRNAAFMRQQGTSEEIWAAPASNDAIEFRFTVMSGGTNLHPGYDKAALFGDCADFDCGSGDCAGTRTFLRLERADRSAVHPGGSGLAWKKGDRLLIPALRSRAIFNEIARAPRSRADSAFHRFGSQTN